MLSNCLVFHTSEGISSSPAAFLFLIFLCSESSSSCVKCPSLMSNCLLIILVIGSGITFRAFLSKFSKYCFHRYIHSSWLVAFSLAFTVLFLLLTLFTICHAILDCLSSTESLILSIWFCMYSVCSFRYMLANSFCAFLSFRALVLVGFFKLLGFKIKIMSNLKVVNFLDITFNLSENSFKPFHEDKPSTISMLILSTLDW